MFNSTHTMIAPFRFGSFPFHSSQHALRLSQQVIHPWHAQAPKPVGLVSSAKEEKHRNTSKNQSEMDHWKQQNKNDIKWLLRTQSHKYPTSACSLCISFHSIAAKVGYSSSRPGGTSTGADRTALAGRARIIVASRGQRIQERHRHRRAAN